MSSPTMLFAGRLVSAHPILAAFCEDFVSRVTGRSRAPIDVPHLPGVGGLGFVRWLYRQWLAGGGAAGVRSSTSTRRAARPTPRRSPTSRVRPRAGGCLSRRAGRRSRSWCRRTCASCARGEVLDLHEAVGERIRWLDRFHLVTADPALESVRRTLLAHCRAGSALHLSGPVGSGRRSLVRWAHAALDDRRLVEVRAGEGRRPSPSDWLLVDGALPLDDATAGWLRARLTAATPPPVPPPVTSRGRRAVHPALAPIVGASPPLVAVLESVAKVATTQLAVLVLGESGAGKESLARAIHEMSGRKGPR